MQKTSSRGGNSFQSAFRKLGAQIFTRLSRQLKEASQDLQVVAKSSGVGGGDCGIALSFDEQSTETIKIAGPIWGLSSYTKKG